VTHLRLAQSERLRRSARWVHSRRTGGGLIAAHRHAAGGERQIALDLPSPPHPVPPVAASPTKLVNRRAAGGSSAPFATICGMSVSGGTGCLRQVGFPQLTSRIVEVRSRSLSSGCGMPAPDAIASARRPAFCRLTAAPMCAFGASKTHCSWTSDDCDLFRSTREVNRMPHPQPAMPGEIR
jgi:hypothetical protein